MAHGKTTYHGTIEEPKMHAGFRGWCPPSKSPLRKTFVPRLRQPAFGLETGDLRRIGSLCLRSTVAPFAGDEDQVSRASVRRQGLTGSLKSVHGVKNGCWARRHGSGCGSHRHEKVSAGLQVRALGLLTHSTSFGIPRGNDDCVEYLDSKAGCLLAGNRLQTQSSDQLCASPPHGRCRRFPPRGWSSGLTTWLL